MKGVNKTHSFAKLEVEDFSRASNTMATSRSMLEGGGAPIGDGLLMVRLKVAVEREEEVAVHAHSAAATTA